MKQARGRKVKDLQGKRFGKLVAQSFERLQTGTGRFRIFWRCACDCGGTTQVMASNITNGYVQSCGCLREHHSFTTKKSSRAERSTHKCWDNMIQRTSNPNRDNYPNYGGRGIKVCNHLKSFSNFVQTMGVRPSGLTLDRTNNEGHYSCGSCDECQVNNWSHNMRWATHKTQQNNRRPRRSRKELIELGLKE